MMPTTESATRRRVVRRKVSRAPAPRLPDRATAYAENVVAGRIQTNRLVRLACERHLRDQARSELRWDAFAAEMAIDFYADVLRLPDDGVAPGEADGENGRPFILSPHQCFNTGSIYGWKRPDGSLRYTFAYIEVSKGDGKTPWLSGVLLRATCAEGVHGAQVFAAAAKKDQALLLLRDADAMRVLSPELTDRLKPSGAFPHTWNLAHLESRSFLRAISSEDAQSGPRVYRAGIDELHEHRTPTVLDLMKAGLKGKRNAFIVGITNSGFDRTSVCWREHEYSVKVLEGALQDDSRFVFIAGLDPCEKCRKEGKEFPTEECPDCDDWRDEKVWRKAAPNLGVSVTWDYYRQQVREAEGMPTLRNTVKRLQFCIWTEGQEKWLAIEEWNACRKPELCRLDALRGRRCYAGIDLAGTSDIAALVLDFPPAGETDPVLVVPFFFMPKDGIEEREKRDRVPYRLWASQGLIELTDGAVTDYRAIRARIKQLRDEHGLVIHEVPYDPDDATLLAAELIDDGFTPVPFYQSKKLYTPPVRDAERLIAKRGVAHPGQAVYDWMFSNVIMERNKQDQVKPIKGHDREKNDGPVAWLMARGRAMLHTGAPATPDSAEVHLL